MFSQLIANADDAAKNILDNPAVAALAAQLRDDAAAFAGRLEQPLRQTSADAEAIANSSISVARECGPLVAAWKSGDTGAAAQVLGMLQALLAQVHQNQQENQSAFQSMSAYHDQILSDQRSVGAAIRDLHARQSALLQLVKDKEHDFSRQRARIRTLQSIPLPLPWMVAEIANLITTGKTIEREISDTHHQLNALQGQLNQADHASSAASGFGAQLTVLEGSLQNLLSAVSMMQGNLQQMVTTLQSTGSAAPPLIVEAYLGTLAAQAKNVITYLGDSQQVAAGAGGAPTPQRNRQGGPSSR